MDMPSDRFFSLAMRVAYYEGVVGKKAQYEQEQAKKKNPARALRSSADEVPLSALGSDLIEMR